MEAEEAREAERLRRLTEQAERVKQAQDERRERLEAERKARDASADKEYVTLSARLNENDRLRRDREGKMRGRSGCVGMLSVLCEAYGDEVSHEESNP